MQKVLKTPAVRKQRQRSILAAACLASVVGSTSAAGNDCGCAAGRGPIYSTLDAFAGGIEKLLGLTKPRGGACDEMICDGGCDAMPMHELMQMPADHPMPGYVGAPPMYVPQQEMHSDVEVSPMADPRPMMRPTPAPSAPMRMSPHRMSPMNAPEQQTQEPFQIREMKKGPTGSGVMPSDTQNDRSIFDAADDPFRDDSARIKRSLPAPTGPASYRSSLRRVPSSR